MIYSGGFTSVHIDRIVLFLLKKPNSRGHFWGELDIMLMPYTFGCPATDVPCEGHCDHCNFHAKRPRCETCSWPQVLDVEIVLKPPKSKNFPAYPLEHTLDPHPTVYVSEFFPFRGSEDPEWILEIRVLLSHGRTPAFFQCSPAPYTWIPKNIEYPPGNWHIPRHFWRWFSSSQGVIF